MNLATPHKYETRIRLLDTAEQIFAEHGYEGTSIRQIAHTAGLNISLISYYFGSKEALYYEIFKQKLTGLHTRLVSASSGIVSVSDKLSKFLKIYIDGYRENLSFQRLLYREVTFLSKSAMRDIIMEHLTRNFKILRSIIDEGVQNGSFKIDDPSLFYLTVFSLLPMSVCGSPLVSIVNCTDTSGNEVLSLEKLSRYLLILLQAEIK
jgi:AcrR family transcriptional regulator